MKPSAIYSCQSCGAQTPKWSGRCVECGRWGTVSEEEPPKSNISNSQRPASAPAKTISLNDLTKTKSPPRTPTGNIELDRLLGGGLVRGEVILLSGEPGIGKSTLLLQIAKSLTQPVLYLAGEESPEQIAVRAERLGLQNANIEFLSETDAGTVAATITARSPALTIIDSIQSLRCAEVGSEAGGPWQVRASGAIITETAKRIGAPIIIVGQITKDGSIAGPKTLEHLVDAVLTFEGDRESGLRFLRVEKNRFGSNEEIAIFRMTERGLEPEINPSKFLLADRATGVSGNAIACLLEGSRPLLAEIQALVSKSAYQTPIRRSTGFDTNRLQMILAVLEKRAGLNLSTLDVYLNVIGGITIRDQAADLAVALAIASAAKDIALPAGLVSAGELGGEIRSVGRIEKRIAESEALGFDTLLFAGSRDQKTSNRIKAIKTLREALQIVGV
jgi:DNA repair protein RadA/Sms